jgi:hypothetical protein
MNFTALTAILLFAVVSVLLMLHVKTDVQALYAKRQNLVKEQISLKELIRVQNAELAHFLSPARLKSLAEKMGLEPTQTSQILPVKPEAIIGNMGGM